MDLEQYKQQLVQLLPPGRAWSNFSDSSFEDLLSGIARELVRVNSRVKDLLNETDPRNCYEMLEDWEQVCGFPDPLFGEASTLDERRQRIVAKLTMSGGQSIKFFKLLAANLGFTIEIEEFDRARVGDRIGVKTNGQDWMYTFAVIAPETTIRTARVNSTICGERLRTWGNTTLENVFQIVKPAHTRVIHKYE